MQVSVRVLRHVVIEDNVDSLNVHASPEQVGGDQDAFLEIFELLVAREPGKRTEIPPGWKHDSHGFLQEH